MEEVDAKRGRIDHIVVVVINYEYYLQELVPEGADMTSAGRDPHQQSAWPRRQEMGLHSYFHRHYSHLFQFTTHSLQFVRFGYLLDAT